LIKPDFLKGHERVDIGVAFSGIEAMGGIGITLHLNLFVQLCLEQLPHFFYSSTFSIYFACIATGLIIALES
jgi:hypothetical protein